MDLDCIAIRRQFGVQYFKHMHDLKTLPQWDIRGLLKKKLIDADKNGFVRHYVDQMMYEANTKWKFFKPQFPQRIVKSNEIEANGFPRVILKYKPPKEMKKISFKQMEQDVCHNMRC